MAGNLMLVIFSRMGSPWSNLVTQINVIITESSDRLAVLMVWVAYADVVPDGEIWPKASDRIAVVYGLNSMSDRSESEK